MKKYLMTAVAALAAASFTSCSNEVDMFEPINFEKGYISLDVQNDDLLTVQTRAGVSSTSTDWYVKVNNDAAITVNDLQGKGYPKKTENTLSVYFKNATLTEALKDNLGWGEAFWSGSSEESFSIDAGKTTSVSVNCGEAQNAAFSVVFNNTFTGVAEAGYKVTASMTKDGTTRSKEFTASTTAGKLLYFEPGTVHYELTGRVNGKDVSIGKDLTVVKGKKYVLTVKANTNGTIKLTISYTEMVDGEAQEITVDAATGEEDKSSSNTTGN